MEKFDKSTLDERTELHTDSDVLMAIKYSISSIETIYSVSTLLV